MLSYLRVYVCVRERGPNYIIVNFLLVLINFLKSLLVPDRLQSFTEVGEFMLSSLLQDIRALFPSDRNPFYAGFGNRDTDEISYLKVGIPKGKIFIINPKVIQGLRAWKMAL